MYSARHILEVFKGMEYRPLACLLGGVIYFFLSETDNIVEENYLIACLHLYILNVLLWLFLVDTHLK